MKATKTTTVTVTMTLDEASGLKWTLLRQPAREDVWVAAFLAALEVAIPGANASSGASK